MGAKGSTVAQWTVRKLRQELSVPASSCFFPPRRWTDWNGLCDLLLSETIIHVMPLMPLASSAARSYIRKKKVIGSFSSLRTGPCQGPCQGWDKTHAQWWTSRASPGVLLGIAVGIAKGVTVRSAVHWEMQGESQWESEWKLHWELQWESVRSALGVAKWIAMAIPVEIELGNVLGIALEITLRVAKRIAMGIPVGVAHLQQGSP